MENVKYSSAKSFLFFNVSNFQFLIKILQAKNVRRYSTHTPSIGLDLKMFYFAYTEGALVHESCAVPSDSALTVT